MVFFRRGHRPIVVVCALASAACIDQPDGGFCPRPTCAVVHRPAPTSRGPAKHAVLFIGDGMGAGCEVAASRYLYGRDDGLVMQRLPYLGASTTWDVQTYDQNASQRQVPSFGYGPPDATVGYDPTEGGPWAPLDDSPAALAYFSASLATDSAAAATALATGYKTDDGNVAWMAGDPPGGQLATILEMARAERGARVGIVSTVPFTHATPAAFASHSPSRDAYTVAAAPADLAIDAQIATMARPDVVIGGGHPAWCAGYVSDQVLGAVRADASYVLVERSPAAEAAVRLADATSRAVVGGEKLFGLFGGVDGSFGRFTLSDADGGGEPVVVRPTPENPTLAEATRAALTVLRASTAFVLVVEQGDIDWSNHAQDAAGMIGGVIDLDAAVQAVVDLVDEPGDAVDWTNTLVVVTADHANGYVRLPRPLPRGDLPAPGSDITYGIAGHTNEPVLVHARGAGVDLLEGAEGALYPGTRLLDNTQIFAAMCRALGLSHCAKNMANLPGG